MCTLSVSNVIYHKFSHGAAFYSRTSVARTAMPCLPGYFELVHESLGKHPIAADIIVFRII